jgi:GTP-binding nuclear protein Ran
MVALKLVFIGDAQTGKTTFAKRLRVDEFERKYVASLGVEVHPVDYNGVSLYVWDTAGDERYTGLAEGYYIQADAAIVFFSVTNRESYNNVRRHIAAFKRVCPNAPVVVVGNKADLTPTFNMWGDNYDYLISCKTKQNFNEPLDNIVATLTN